jgi:hypothetical protein
MVHNKTLALNRKLLSGRRIAVVAFAIAAAACSAQAYATEAMPSQLALAVEGLSGVQAEIVADDIVTMEELDLAAQQVKGCIVAAGITVESFSFENGDIRVRMVIDESEATSSDVSRAEDVHDQCLEKEYQTVSDVYNFQNRLNAAEQRELEKRYLECLNDQGLDIANLEEVSADRDERTFSTVVHCSEILEAEGY